MSRILAVCGLVLGLSCCGGQREQRDAYASVEVRVFLAGFRQAVIRDDQELLLDKYIDPCYRREQLEDLLGGDRRQFFDELFGLGRRRFSDIAEMEFVGGDVHFARPEYGPRSDIEVAQCSVVLTYEDGGQVEDCVYLIKYSNGERTFAVEGPRG